jgi:hypothetical protein
LRTTADVEALITADGSEDEPENDGFGETLHEVGELEGSDGTLPESEGIEAERKDAGNHAAEESDENGDGSQQGNRHKRRDHTGSDEFAARVGAHGAHGVDLFSDDHRAEFRGDTGRAAASNKEAGDGRAKFADERERNDIAGERGLAKAYELGPRLENHDGTDKETGEKNDGERADTDVVHLIESVLNIARLAGEIGEGAVREFGIVLDSEDGLFGNVLQYLHDRRSVGSDSVLMGNLKRCLSHLVLVVSSEESVTGDARSVKSIATRCR